MVAVKWCEAEVRSFEWTNTFSNLIFAITAYVGWRLAKERGLPFEFVAAELGAHRRVRRQRSSFTARRARRGAPSF